MNITLTTPDQQSQDLIFSKLLKNYPYTILYFYPKDDTPGCTIEAQDFTQFAPQFIKIKTQIIGVSKDSHTSHCKFIGKFWLTFPLISDTTLELHHHFKTLGEKKMYGKTYQGTIRSTFLLDEKGEIIHERRNISSSWHAQEVLDTLIEITK